LCFALFSTSKEKEESLLQDLQGVFLLFFGRHTSLKEVPNQTNQPTDLKQQVGFFPKKSTFGSKTKKIASNLYNRGIRTVGSRTFPTSNQETEARTEEKLIRQICHYDPGLEFEASLETRVHANCP